MADDREAEAIDTITRRIIRHVLEAAMEGQSTAFVVKQDYEHLSIEQRERVRNRAHAITDALDPGEESFVAAYEYLTGETP